MAEQEACTVEKATQEQAGGKLEGECLLLPLLQGLLDAPENEQTADSGTESGEDQRSGLIAEVQNALDKLAASLRSDATDMTPERKNSLLQLVTKLQAGLATSVPPSERRASCQGRFNRRRHRQNRHTVGVSSEELADARRLIEEISLGNVVPQKQSKTDLQKQRSEGSIIQQSSSNSSFRSISLNNSKSPVKNATAKPYSSSNSTTQSISGTPSPGNTPTDASEGLSFIFSEEPKQENSNHNLAVKMRDKKLSPTYNQSISMEEKKCNTNAYPKRPLSESISQNYNPLIYNPLSPLQNLLHVQTNERRLNSSEDTQGSETDDDPSTLKGHQGQPGILMQDNALYKPLTHEEKCNRFNTKKLKMKRANTIDIPKPLNFYQDDDSDTDTAEEDYQQRRRSNYLALRGPIRVGNPGCKNTVPVLEPRTESDRKFLAFINKNNENSSVKASLWSQPDNKGSVWGSKFGKIQRTFEKGAAGNNSTRSQNSAMKFWKTADDSATRNNSSSHIGPRISKQSAKNLQQMFEEKQRQSQKAQLNQNQNIVTGSLVLNTKPLEQEKTYKFVPQPLPVNKFSHAPQSAFQPIPKKPQCFGNKPDLVNLPKQIVKTELRVSNNSDSDSPLYLYSPKQTPNDSSTTSPVTSKPWMSESGEHRVLKLAASKFENPQPQNYNTPLRRGSKENKIIIPPSLQQQNRENEKLTAPYLVKSVAPKAGSTVRKLSDQYDSLNVKTNESFVPQNTVKYVPPQPDRTHYGGTAYLPNQQNITQTKANYGNRPLSNDYQYTPHNQHYNNRQQHTPQTYGYSYQNGVQRTPQTYGQQHNEQYNYNANQQFNQNYNLHDQPEDIQYTSTYQFQPKQSAQPHVFYNNVVPKPLPQTYNVNITTETSTYLPQETQKTLPTPPPKQETAKPLQKSDINFVPPKLETQLSNESVHEHLAVSSKVMIGPVSQQAVTVRQKSPMSREGHDMEAALNLRNTLQNKTANKSPPSSFTYSTPKETTSQQLKPSTFKFSEQEKPDPTSPRPSSFKFKSSQEQSNVLYNNCRLQGQNVTRNEQNEGKNIAIARPIQQKPLSSQTVHTNSKGEAVLTSKFQIPIIKTSSDDTPKRPSPGQVLSKSDSWHQICMQSQTPQGKPSPRSSPNSRPVMKSKSSHSLAVPKLFEAGMSKEEMLQKKKTMEAFLSGTKSPPSGTRSPTNDTGGKTVKRSINRIKTSEKTSTSSFRQNGGISRSRTLPDIVCPNLLDESNVDQAFDDLFKSST